MEFGNLPLVSMMTKKMAWLTRRSEVLAQNVANSDTPGYRARDLKEVNFGEMVARERSGGRTFARPTLTHPAHMDGRSGSTIAFRVSDDPGKHQPTVSGNTVSMEQQMQRVGETQLAYQMVVDLYRKHLGLFRTAIGRGN